MNTPLEKPKPIFFFSLLIVGVIIASIMLLELGLRITADRQLRSMLTLARVMHYENRRGLVLTPNLEMKHELPTGEAEYTIKINGQGLRQNQDVPLQKKAGQYRILVLGDSFTFGLGVNNDETYPAQLEKLLNGTNGGGKYEVINAGFAGGNCPLTHYLFLKDHGRQFSPDLVIEGFFAGNDLQDMRLYTEVRDENGLPIKALAPGGDLWPWIKRTAIYQELGLRKIYPLLAHKTANVGTAPDANGELRPATGNNESAIPTTLTRAQELLLAMRDLLGKQGAQFKLVFIPAMESVFSGRDPITDKVRAELAEFCLFSSINWLDLTPALRRGGPDCYFDEDRHFTIKGNRIAAEEMAKQVRSSSSINNRALSEETQK